MRWMTIPVVAGRGALRAPLTPQNLNPRDHQRKRRRGRRKKRRKRKRREEGVERAKVEAGSRSRAAGTAVWRKGRWGFGTWAWASTQTRLSSLSFVWAPASPQEQTTTWHWRRCWRTARCPAAPPARSAATPAAGPTGTSRFPSWTPRPRGGPSSRYQQPAACAWAEEVNEGEGDKRGVTHPEVARCDEGLGARGGHCNTLTAEEVMVAACWLPAVYFLLRWTRSGRSWTIEVKIRVRGKSSGSHSLDLLLRLQRVNCFLLMQDTPEQLSHIK